MPGRQGICALRKLNPACGSADLFRTPSAALTLLFPVPSRGVAVGRVDCSCAGEPPAPRDDKIIHMTETDQPWHHAGLRFRCTQCGHCCTGAPGFVWVTDAEIQAIADFLGESVEQVTARHTRVEHRGRSLREKANGDCVFYDKTAGCTIYEARPAQCRTWPFW